MRILLSILLLAPSLLLADVYVINVTNNITGYTDTNGTYSMTAGDALWLSVKAQDAAGSNVNFATSAGTTFRADIYSMYITPRYRYLTTSGDDTPSINPTNGEARATFGSVDTPGEYALEMWAIPNGSEDQQYPIAMHYLTVTSAPSASGATISGNVTINYMTGGIVSNVLEGTSNSWNAVTGELIINTNPPSTGIDTNTYLNEGAATLNGVPITNGANITVAAEIPVYLTPENRGDTGAEWVIAITGTTSVLSYNQNGVDITNILFAVDDTNNVAAAEVLLAVSTTNSIAFPATIRWGSGTAPTDVTNVWHRFVFSIFRENNSGASLGGSL